ncbi:MAG: helix-turn-helix transcriptional regulator [Candidatus Binatota bacterium]
MNKALKGILARNLRAFRLRAGLSQSDLARKAGTLQPRVAVMESAEDPTLPRLEWLGRVAEAVGVPVSDLVSERVGPEADSLPDLPEDGDNLAAHLKGLGAPLTGPSRKNRAFSPEAVVLGVLRVVPSSRMVECLPGLLFKKEMDHEKLLRLAKGRGLVNRLGFVVDVAVTLAEENRDREKLSRLRALSKKLWMERRKEAEEFLMSEAPEDPELRNWLKKKTPRAGKKWGVYGAYSRERFREALKRAA